MIETNKPRLEDLHEGEELPTEVEKTHIPVAGIIILASLAIVIIALVIVVAIINGRVPMEEVSH